MKRSAILASIITCVFSMTAHADCDLTAATGRKILHLGDSISAQVRQGILDREAATGADMEFTDVIAVGGFTINGTTPFAPENPTHPWWHDPTAPTFWQNRLGEKGQTISQFDGVIVELGTNDAGHVGEYNTTQDELIENNIGALINWLQPSASRPVVWLLPLYTAFPNSTVPLEALSSDAKTCYCRFYTGSYSSEETIKAETPNIESLIPSEYFSEFCEPHSRMYILDNYATMCQTVAEIRHDAGDDSVAKLKIRKTLLELEAQYPHLYIANDIAELYAYFQQGDYYSHLTDGTHFDKGDFVPDSNNDPTTSPLPSTAPAFFADYSLYISSLLANNIDCRSQLVQQRDWIDFPDTIFNEFNDHVVRYFHTN